MLPGLALLEQSWEQRRPKLTDEQLRARKAHADQMLDALLADFVRDGYQTDMKERLFETVNTALIDFELETVYILPDDLAALLKSIGNPLVEYGAYEDAEEAEKRAPTFDLNNPAHRVALNEKIESFGQ